MRALLLLAVACTNATQPTPDAAPVAPITRCEIHIGNASAMWPQLAPEHDREAQLADWYQSLMVYYQIAQCPYTVMVP